MLGRIVFQAHPLVLFRSEALEDEATRHFASRLLPDVYSEYVTGERALLPAEENRVLRALSGFAFWKGSYDWIYTLAFQMIERKRGHDVLSFLAMMLALREGRTALASYFKNKIQCRTEWMEVLERGLFSPYDELGGIASSVPFFNPGARRRGGQVVQFKSIRAARDAALGWFLCSGSFSSLRTASRAASWIFKDAMAAAGALEEDLAFVIETPYTQLHLEAQAGFRPGLRLALASRSMELGDFEQADAWLRYLMNRHPRILHMRASCHRSLGELGLAVQEYRRIVKRHPGEKIFVENYARILMDLGRQDEAEKALRHAGTLASRTR
jgi:tetratricopeptide (TPR) repeat protein